MKENSQIYKLSHSQEMAEIYKKKIATKTGWIFQIDTRVIFSGMCQTLTYSVFVTLLIALGVSLLRPLALVKW